MAEHRLPPSLVAALGLMGTTTACACLKIADPDTGPCLSPPIETGDTGDTGDTADTSDTRDTDETRQRLYRHVSTDVSAALDAVLARRVLPADVAARLRARRK